MLIKKPTHTSSGKDLAGIINIAPSIQAVVAIYSYVSTKALGANQQYRKQLYSLKN